MYEDGRKKGRSKLVKKSNESMVITKDLIMKVDRSRESPL